MIKYLHGHVSQTSAWVGLLVIIGELFISPRFVLAFGVVLLLVKDETLKGLVDKTAPWLQSHLARIMSD